VRASASAVSAPGQHATDDEAPLARRSSSCSSLPWPCSNTSEVEVLRRPVESAIEAAVLMDSTSSSYSGIDAVFLVYLLGSTVTDQFIGALEKSQGAQTDWVDSHIVSPEL